MHDRTFPNTLIEVKKMATESTRFRNEEIPTRQREKQRLNNAFRELTKHLESATDIDLEPELHIETIEKNWSRLLLAHQDKDQAIQDELKRLERLQRLAEKVINLFEISIDPWRPRCTDNITCLKFQTPPYKFHVVAEG